MYCKYEFNILIDFNANYLNSDIIDVNKKLSVNNIDVVNLINNNFNDYQKIYMIYQKI